jgi:hypothetical protein
MGDGRQVPAVTARGALALFLGLLGFAVFRLIRGGSGTPSRSFLDDR